MLGLAVIAGCSNAGSAYVKLEGNEEDLPLELKGLKVYRVSTGSGSYINVATLGDRVNSVSYAVGKTTNYTIMLDNKVSTTVYATEILSENDSIIVIKKK